MKASFNGGALETFGLIVSNLSPYFYVSGLAISTFGFVYGTGDTWVNADNIQEITWSACDCSALCE